MQESTSYVYHLYLTLLRRYGCINKCHTKDNITPKGQAGKPGFPVHTVWEKLSFLKIFALEDVLTKKSVFVWMKVQTALEQAVFQTIPICTRPQSKQKDSIKWKTLPANVTYSNLKVELINITLTWDQTKMPFVRQHLTKYLYYKFEKCVPRNELFLVFLIMDSLLTSS